jgi:prevent-host-death family protein
MVVRSISEAKAELSALIEAVQNGSEVIIAKAGKPVARLVAFRGPARPRTPGSMAGEIWIAPDFDALPDDMAETLGMNASLAAGGQSVALRPCEGTNPRP